MRALKPAMFNVQFTVLENPLYNIRKNPRAKRTPTNTTRPGKARNSEFGGAKVIVADRVLKRYLVPRASSPQQKRKDKSEQAQPASKPEVGFVDVLLKLSWRHS